MTNERKICRQCRGPVTIQRTVAVERLAARLDPREYPAKAPLIFRCPTHGLLAWWQITHGEAVRRSSADPKEETQGCLL